MTQYSNCASENTADAVRLVPESLYLFLSVLLTGEPGPHSEETDETIRRLSLSFGQDIVYAITKGKTITPKHVGLGMTIQHGRQHDQKLWLTFCTVPVIPSATARCNV